MLPSGLTMPARTMSDALTPCLKICALDPVSGLCLGCGRTGDEIAAWSRMDNADRMRVMALLADRLAALGVNASAKPSAQ
jgi:predicted Fe-S protein YdhL (DUF1289 family)